VTPPAPQNIIKPESHLNKAVSIVVPTYNEKGNVNPLVERIDRALAGADYEVVFIDDNSRDGTAEAVAELSQKYPVRVIVRKDKRGLASAVVDGIGYATADIVCVIDADLQHPPEVIPLLIKGLQEGADVSIGSRYVRGGGLEGWSLTRRVISKGAIALAHVFLPQTRAVKDPMSGFFAFKKPVVYGVRLEPEGYKILLEILMLGKYSGIVEVPFAFTVRSRGESKLNTRQQIAYLKHLFSLMKRTGEFRRFLTFCLVGLSGVFVNQGMLWFLTDIEKVRYLVSSPFAIEASIISNFLLNDRFTFSDRRKPGWRAGLVRALKFNLVSLPGLLINQGVLWLFTEVFGLYYLISNLIGIAMAMLWNYLVNTWWTWKR
jgi:dolichol-phosphate mannosyltransferase